MAVRQELIDAVIQGDTQLAQREAELSQRFGGLSGEELNFLRRFTGENTLATPAQRADLVLRGQRGEPIATQHPNLVSSQHPQISSMPQVSLSHTDSFFPDIDSLPGGAGPIGGPNLFGPFPTHFPRTPPIVPGAPGEFPNLNVPTLGPFSFPNFGPRTMPGTTPTTVPGQSGPQQQGGGTADQLGRTGRGLAQGFFQQGSGFPSANVPSFGGGSPGDLGAMTDFFTQSLFGMSPLNFGQQINPQTLNNFLGQAPSFSGFPGIDPILAQAIQQGAGNLPFLQEQLNYLQQEGLPGQQQLQDPSQFQQLLGGASQNLNNTNAALNFILNQGLPGQIGIQNLIGQQQQFGQGQQQNAAGIFNQLLSQGLPQGAQQPQFFQDILQQALNIGGPDGLQAPQIAQQPGAQAPGIQNTTMGAIEGLIAGGGLSPEFVEATRQRVLDPALEAQTARLQQQGRGAAEVGSGLFEEQRRRTEADFNADLIRAGFENLLGATAQGAQLGQQGFGQQFANQQLAQEAQLANLRSQLETQGLGVGAGLQGLGIGAGLSQQEIQRQLANAGLGLEGLGLQAGIGGQIAGQGQQGIQNALGSFGSVAQNVFPFLNLSGQMGLGQQGAALNQFDVIGNRGLDLLRTVSDLSFAPLQFGEQIASNRFGQNLASMGMFGDIGTQLFNTAVQQQLAQQGILGDLARAGITGQFGLLTSEAGVPGIGASIISGLINSAPGILNFLNDIGIFGGGNP